MVGSDTYLLAIRQTQEQTAWRSYGKCWCQICEKFQLKKITCLNIIIYFILLLIKMLELSYFSCWTIHRYRMIWRCTVLCDRKKSLYTIPITFVVSFVRVMTPCPCCIAQWIKCQTWKYEVNGLSLEWCRFSLGKDFISSLFQRKKLRATS